MEQASIPIFLNIYTLQTHTQPTTSDDSNATITCNNNTALATFMASVMTPMGFGAYHTSIDVNTYSYTFSARSGIVKSSLSKKDSQLPPNCFFKETILLGHCTYFEKEDIPGVVNRLRQFFTENSTYHIVNRNCNHFTEVFATALILAERFADVHFKGSLDSYPSYVNRLAKTGTIVINHGNVCNVRKEAKVGAGVEGKVGWDFPSEKTMTNAGYGKTSCPKNDKKKGKLLTEKQKLALAKLKRKT